MKDEKILTEATNGNMAFFYHGDDAAPDKFLQWIANGTYDNTSSFYGKGMYCVRNPLDAMMNGYGSNVPGTGGQAGYVYKIYVRNLKDFLHLDKLTFSRTFPEAATTIFGKASKKKFFDAESDDNILMPKARPGEEPEKAWYMVANANKRAHFKNAQITKANHNLDHIKWQLERRGVVLTPGSVGGRLLNKVEAIVDLLVSWDHSPKLTSDILYEIWELVISLGFEGVTYTGERDRRCALIYNLSNVVPVGWARHVQYNRDRKYTDVLSFKDIDRQNDNFKVALTNYQPSEFRPEGKIPKGIQKAEYIFSRCMFLNDYTPDDIEPFLSSIGKNEAAFSQLVNELEKSAERKYQERMQNPIGGISNAFADMRTTKRILEEYLAMGIEDFSKKREFFNHLVETMERIPTRPSHWLSSNLGPAFGMWTVGGSGTTKGVFEAFLFLEESIPQCMALIKTILDSIEKNPALFSMSANDFEYFRHLYRNTRDDSVRKRDMLYDIYDKAFNHKVVDPDKESGPNIVQQYVTKRLYNAIKSVDSLNDEWLGLVHKLQEVSK